MQKVISVLRNNIQFFLDTVNKLPSSEMVLPHTPSL